MLFVMLSGIGFKATAVMSELTYISSNGYQFCFDMRKSAYPNTPGLGLVCPLWVEDLPQQLESWVQKEAHAGAFGTLLARSVNLCRTRE
jgi:hypothetical protein